jgi:hypothetical protein
LCGRAITRVYLFLIQRSHSLTQNFTEQMFSFSEKKYVRYGYDLRYFQEWGLFIPKYMEQVLYEPGMFQYGTTSQQSRSKFHQYEYE